MNKTVEVISKTYLIRQLAFTLQNKLSMYLPKYRSLNHGPLVFSLLLGALPLEPVDSIGANTQPEIHIVGKGQVKDLTIDSGSTLRESCQKTVRFEEKNKTTVVIKGLQPGTCFFQIRSGPKIQIHKLLVVPAERVRAMEAVEYVRSKWSQIGIELNFESGRAALSGLLNDAQLYIALKREVATLEEVRWDITSSSATLREVESIVTQDLKSSGYGHLEVLSVDGRWQISGRTDIHDPELDPVTWITRHYWPMLDSVQRIYRGDPQLQLDMEFHEVRRIAGHRLGIEWPQWVEFILGNTQTQSSNLLYLHGGNIGGSLTIVGHLHDWTQYAKLLAHPKLVCLSGERVTFHSGGTFAIENRAREFASTDWKRHGLEVVVLPKWEPKTKTVQAELRVSYSNPDEKDGTRITGLNKTSIKTHFRADPGVPVVLTGFSQQISKELRQGLPWTHHIPWIRWFAGHETKSQEEKELALKITITVGQPIEKKLSHVSDF